MSSGVGLEVHRCLLGRRLSWSPTRLGALRQHKPSSTGSDLIFGGQENSAELVISEGNEESAPSSVHALWFGLRGQISLHTN